jgi:hypothetical protein
MYLNALAESPHSNNLKLKFGVGLGLGIPLLVGVVFGAYWFLIRKKKKTFVPRPKYIPGDLPDQPQPSRPREQSYAERSDSIVVEEWKDKSLLPQ